MAICLSFSVKGQDCNFDAYIKELVNLGGTYLKDFQVKPKSTDKNANYLFSMILSKNTRYLFSCKSNETITFSLYKQIYIRPAINNNKSEAIFLDIPSIFDCHTDNTGKPIFFEYTPNETAAYSLEISGINKKSCTVALISYLGTLNPNEVVDTTKIYEFVDQQAIFENGNIYNFRNYILKNFRISSKLKNFNRKLTIEFVVGINGNIENPKIIFTSGKREMDLQALTIIKDAPKWKPAKINGVNVKQRFRMVLQ